MSDSSDTHLPDQVGAFAFGQHLDRFIEERSYVKAGIAEKANITPQHLNRILKGSGTVTLDIALRLCEACGVNIHDLLEDKISLERSQRMLVSELGATFASGSEEEILRYVKQLAPSRVSLRSLTSLFDVLRMSSSSIFEPPAPVSPGHRSKFAGWVNRWSRSEDLEGRDGGDAPALLRKLAVDRSLDSLNELSRRSLLLGNDTVSWPIVPCTTAKYVEILSQVMKVAADRGPVTVFSVTSLLPSQWYEPSMNIAEALKGYRKSIQEALASRPGLRMNRLIVMADEVQGVDDSLVRAGLLRSAKLDSEQSRSEELQRFVYELHSRPGDARYASLREQWGTLIGGEHVTLDQFTKQFRNAAASLFDLVLVGEFRKSETVPEWSFGVTGSMNLSEDLVPLGILTEPELLRYVGSFWYSMYDRAKHWEDLLPEGKVD